MTKKKVSTEDENPALRKGAVSGSFVAYQTFLIEAVNEMLKADRSIVKDGFVRISIDEEYKCSDADLAKYKIEYEYPLHLIHLGQDLHRAELKLSDELKGKWYVR
jgi:hypothetical protein